MDVKRKVSDMKTSINSRQTSDLEKRKLEAELKAAEEMAKIKEAVIEKRLAFELASLRDTVVPASTPPSSPPPALPRPMVKNLEASGPQFSNRIVNNVAVEPASTEDINRSSLHLQPTLKAPVLPLFDDFTKVSSNNTKKLQATLKTAFAEPKPSAPVPVIQVTEKESSDTEECEDEEKSNAGDSECQYEEVAEEGGEEEEEDTEETYSPVGTKSKFLWKSIMSTVKTKLKFRKPEKW